MNRYPLCNERESVLLAKLVIRYSSILLTNYDLMLVDKLPDGTYIDFGRIIALLNEISENSGNYTFDKMNRWIGYIQGTLISVGLLDVDNEREFTRPLFHELHGWSIPTFDAKKPE